MLQEEGKKEAALTNPGPKVIALPAWQDRGVNSLAIAKIPLLRKDRERALPGVDSKTSSSVINRPVDTSHYAIAAKQHSFLTALPCSVLATSFLLTLLLVNTATGTFYNTHSVECYRPLLAYFFPAPREPVLYASLTGEFLSVVDSVTGASNAYTLLSGVGFELRGGSSRVTRARAKAFDCDSGRKMPFFHT